jgi:Bacterial PH domain
MEAELAANGDRIYRQRGVRRALKITSIATVALIVPIWIAIAVGEIHHEQPRYTALGSGLLCLGIFGFMFAYTRIFSRPKIVASSAGLTLVNYFSSKSVTWDQVKGSTWGERKAASRYV